MTNGELAARLVHGALLQLEGFKPIPGTVCATENMGSFEMILDLPAAGPDAIELHGRRVRVTVELPK